MWKSETLHVLVVSFKLVCLRESDSLRCAWNVTSLYSYIYVQDLDPCRSIHARCMQLVVLHSHYLLVSQDVAECLHYKHIAAWPFVLL